MLALHTRNNAAKHLKSVMNGLILIQSDINWKSYYASELNSTVLLLAQQQQSVQEDDANAIFQSDANKRFYEIEHKSFIG